MRVRRLAPGSTSSSSKTQIRKSKSRCPFSSMVPPKPKRTTRMSATCATTAKPHQTAGSKGMSITEDGPQRESSSKVSPLMNGTTLRVRATSVQAAMNGPSSTARALAIPSKAWTKSANRARPEAKISCTSDDPPGRAATRSISCASARQALSTRAKLPYRVAAPLPSSKDLLRMSPVRASTSGTSPPKSGPKTTRSVPRKTATSATKRPTGVTMSSAPPFTWASVKTTRRRHGLAAAAAARKVASQGTSSSRLVSWALNAASVQKKAVTKPMPSSNCSKTDA
mmetsp:Transcript_81397/g.153871  ORF Transcript_81397/g.153871 Transcript_81397/m.153871 type:complete len:283 (+) Transcript_81397:427-1275(+)